MMKSFSLRGALTAALLSTTMLGASAADKPTDPQIAHIAYTAGTVDIGYAKIALERSKTKSVRDFATNMIKDHTAVNDKALALVKKLGVTPEDNETSQTLAKQAADERAELSKLSGTAFDRAYAENEVAYHRFVNGALEKTLIPAAENEELASLLRTGLKLFQGHQIHAEHVVKSLGRMTSLWRSPQNAE